MFHTVFCATIESRSSDGLAKISGVPGRIDGVSAVLTGEPASRIEQPIITFDGGDKTVHNLPFITNCNKASVF